MKRKLIFVLLMSGIILSPMGAYAMNDEGGAPRTPPSKFYRVPVTVLPSGDVKLPSGTILSPKASARDVLKEMTQKDKEIGQGINRKSLQPGSTYFSISIMDDAFEGTQHGGLYPGFWQLKGALETIKPPSATPAPRPELETAH